MTAWEQGTEIEYQHLGGLPATLDSKRCSHQQQPTNITRMETHKGCLPLAIRHITSHHIAHVDIHTP